jgi:uncharacterized tellurite resistance protein B-like protein
MSFLTDLINKIRGLFSAGNQLIAQAESAKYKAELIQTVASSMADGKLTREEVMNIVRLKDRLGISDADLASIGGESFVQMFNAARDAALSVDNLAHDTQHLSEQVKNLQGFATATNQEEAERFKAQLGKVISIAMTDDELSNEEVLNIVALQQKAGISDEELAQIGGADFAQMFATVRGAVAQMDAMGVK